jgi:outer membrane protein TolC
MGAIRRIAALGTVAALMAAVGCTSAPEVAPTGPKVRAQEPTRTAVLPTFPGPPEELEQGRGPLPESKPPLAPNETPLPINLASALQLAGARPLDVQIAGRQVEAAAAVYDRAKLLWVPNLVLGLDYFGHTGLQQNFAGEIVGSNRNTLMAGLGPNVVFAFSDAVYAPLAARQDLRARQAREQATINDVSLDVAEAYFTVQQARGELAGSLLAVKQAEDLVNRAAGLGKGLAPPQEEARAKVELARRRQAAIAARERWRTASAELARLLRLDPSAVVEPVEPPFLPVTVIDPTVPVDGLIPVALTARPELAGNQALVEATLARLKQEKLRPLVPSLAVRSASTNPAGTLGYGAFGGSGGGHPSTSGSRFDIDLQLLWEFQAFGLANRARVTERRAEHAAAMLELFKTQDTIASEVVRAFAQVRSAAERLNEAEPALRDAVELVNQSIEGLGQTRRVGEALLLVTRPQEAVAAVQAFAQANTDFYAAVADYNRAQFRLYRALGHPAQCLATAVPGADAKMTFPDPQPKATVPEAPKPVPAQPKPPAVVPPVKEEKPKGLPPTGPASSIPAPTGGAAGPVPGLVAPRELPVVTPRESSSGTRVAPRNGAVPVPPAVWPDDPMPPAPVVPTRPAAPPPGDLPAIPEIPPGGAYRRR